MVFLPKAREGQCYKSLSFVCNSSVAARLALQASNVALGSAISLNFPMLFPIHFGNKDLTHDTRKILP